MKNRNNKGFTLTELIIVIVIIGILAGVLIPTLSGYVAKSRLSADTQMVKGMNTVLQAEAIDQDVAYFDSLDTVKAILTANGVKNFETKSKNNTIWYNRANNMVELLNTDQALSGVSAASTSEYSYQLEQISNNPALLYMDQRDNGITKTLNNIANFIANLNAAPTAAAFEACFDSELKGSKAKYPNAYNNLQQFSPEHTMYVNDKGFWIADSVAVAAGTVSVENAVFAKGLAEMGNSTSVADNITIKVLNGIYLPASLDVSKLTDSTKMLNTLDPYNEIIVNQSDSNISVKLISLGLSCDVIVNSNKNSTVDLSFIFVYQDELGNDMTFVRLKGNGEVNTIEPTMKVKDENQVEHTCNGEIRLDIKTNYFIDLEGKNLVFKSVSDYGLTTLTVYCYDEDKVIAAGIVKYVYLTENN